MSDSLSVLRLGEDSFGESHFDSFIVERLLQDFAPPARPLFVSAVEEASGYAVLRLPVGWGANAIHRRTARCCTVCRERRKSQPAMVTFVSSKLAMHGSWKTRAARVTKAR